MSEAPIDFYFDFSSPYGYFAAEGLEDVVAPFGRHVRWHPVLIGVVMRETGSKPLMEVPVKGEYMIRDCDRLARFMDVPWQVPEPFPISTVTAARAFYAQEDMDGGDQTRARAFARALYRAYFGEGRNIGHTEVVMDVAKSLDLDCSALSEGLTVQHIKERLRTEIASSVEKGVFGSPFVIIDGEPFWGSDRFWMIKRWLRRGGW